MSNNNYTVKDGKQLFIRIPRDFEEGAIAYLELDEELAGKTVCVEIRNNDSRDIPFNHDALEDKNEKAEVTYYGRWASWKPQNISYDCVKGHPDCRPGECGHTCHVVSCPVYQGNEEEIIQHVSYVRSDLL